MLPCQPLGGMMLCTSQQAEIHLSLLKRQSARQLLYPAARNPGSPKSYRLHWMFLAGAPGMHSIVESQLEVRHASHKTTVASPCEHVHKLSWNIPGMATILIASCQLLAGSSAFQQWCAISQTFAGQGGTHLCLISHHQISAIWKVMVLNSQNP